MPAAPARLTLCRVLAALTVAACRGRPRRSLRDPPFLPPARIVEERGSTRAAKTEQTGASPGSRDPLGSQRRLSCARKGRRRATASRTASVPAPLQTRRHSRVSGELAPPRAHAHPPTPATPVFASRWRDGRETRPIRPKHPSPADRGAVRVRAPPPVRFSPSPR